MKQTKLSSEVPSERQNMGVLPRTRDVLGYSKPGNLTDTPSDRQNSQHGDLRRSKNKLTPDNQSFVGELKNREDFQNYVSQNLWETRRDRGLPWRMNVFEFIEKTYGEWIAEEHMCQADLIGLDDALYGAMRHRFSLYGAPDGFHFPTQYEATLNAIKDPDERAFRELSREVDRRRKAAQRVAPRP